MRIDLGCGQQKFPGCIGIDLIPYDGVDLVHNLNDPLPFHDDSAEFLIASHSLQYVHNLNNVLHEIYRVCKHKAIVCIVAPYAHVTANMVNPLYKQQFNEHSPRYWTQDNHKLIGDEEHFFSWPPAWSLAEPVPGAAPIDLRLIRMEFFYFPEYGAYDDLELVLLRQSQLNVAYQIMYHFLVIKEPVSTPDLEMWRSCELEEPLYVKEQRAAFRNLRYGDRWVQTEHLSAILDADQLHPSLEASAAPSADDPHLAAPKPTSDIPPPDTKHPHHRSGRRTKANPSRVSRHSRSKEPSAKNKSRINKKKPGKRN